MRYGEHFAEQANASTTTMGKLTVQIHELATKSQQETASMHAITILTLFFLPGTFVAVRYSLLHLNR